MTASYNHYYLPMVYQGHIFTTDFQQQFDKADHEGADAINETCRRIHDCNEHNLKILKEVNLK